MRSGIERCFMELFVGAVKVRDKCQAECILDVIYIFDFQVAFGVCHRVSCPRSCIHKISNARPRPDTSTLQPAPESLIVFTKSQGLYVPASVKTLSTYTRKRGVLLHKKCNNCRNVAKLKYKSFVCTNPICEFCAYLM